MMPWRRHRRTRSTLAPGQQADAWQAVSLLLDYPDETLVQRLPMLDEVAAGLPAAVGAPLRRFVAHASATPLQELQTDYVETFDVTRRCALHLTYFLHGDTRNRGAALVRFKQLYRQHGVELPDRPEGGDAELPDHLCVVLEFGATVAPEAAWKLLNDHRVGIELLRRALDHRGSPWLDVVQVLRATLPGLDGDDQQALAKLIADGPPQETVGLDDALNAPYSIDPALDGSSRPPPQAERHTSLGPTIPVGAPR